MIRNMWYSFLYLVTVTKGRLLIAWLKLQKYRTRFGHETIFHAYDLFRWRKHDNSFPNVGPCFSRCMECLCYLWPVNRSGDVLLRSAPDFIRGGYHKLLDCSFVVAWKSAWIKTVPRPTGINENCCSSVSVYLWPAPCVSVSISSLQHRTASWWNCGWYVKRFANTGFWSRPDIEMVRDVSGVELFNAIFQHAFSILNK